MPRLWPQSMKTCKGWFNVYGVMVARATATTTREHQTAKFRPGITFCWSLMLSYGHVHGRPDNFVIERTAVHLVPRFGGMLPIKRLLRVCMWPGQTPHYVRATSPPQSPQGLPLMRHYCNILRQHLRSTASRAVSMSAPAAFAGQDTGWQLPHKLVQAEVGSFAQLWLRTLCKLQVLPTQACKCALLLRGLDLPTPSHFQRRRLVQLGLWCGSSVTYQMEFGSEKAAACFLFAGSRYPGSPSHTSWSLPPTITALGPGLVMDGPCIPVAELLQRDRVRQVLAACRSATTHLRRLRERRRQKNREEMRREMGVS